MRGRSCAWARFIVGSQRGPRRHKAATPGRSHCSTLWSRLSPNSHGYDIATHTAGPQAGDVVVVTHEAVLAALVRGKLSIATALDRGLLVVDGESTAVDSVRSLLNESFGKKKEKSSE